MFLVLNSYCIPTGAALANISSSYWKFDSVSETYERAIADLNVAKWLILVAAIIANVLAFIYLKLVACIARFVIWFTILVLFVGMSIFLKLNCFALCLNYLFFVLFCFFCCCLVFSITTMLSRWFYV